MITTTMIVAAALVGGVLLFVFLGVRYVPNNRVGIVEKRFGGGSVHEGLIALEGQAGFQPDVLRGGVHWRMPFQYAVHRMPLVTIPQGKLGYVFARDGVSLSPMQSLGSNASAKDFEDVRGFLAQGGQRGPQRQILREGTYAINLAQFVVITEQTLYFLRIGGDDAQIFEQMASVLAERGGFEPIILRGSEDVVGIVTVHDGPPLDDGQIIAPTPPTTTGDGGGHNSFQDPEAFLALGGRRGRQLQVLVEGTYYVNRLFATCEFVNKTVVEVGFVGVVISYTGETGLDLSGKEYTHGELVARGTRGVWSEPLLPGKYAFNTYAGKVVMVPTTNFMLKWIRSEAGEHAFDKNLSEVSLITKDAFEPSLPLSVVVHIDYTKAPMVIQRFGDIRRLVEQTLDPMVAAYFKNIAQNRTLIQLLQDRSNIQEQAGREMREKFRAYNLELSEVLIGTPRSAATGPTSGNRIETILEQLRARQVAAEQVETYQQQELAARQERELRQAEAFAQQQTKLTESELAIRIQENQGKAEYQRALQQASQVKAMAEADASRVKMMAEAEAEKSARVGVAQAIAVEEQVRAYGGPVYQLTQSVLGRFAEAVQQSKVDVVPKIVIGGQAGGAGGAGGGGLMEALLAVLLSDKMIGLSGQAGATTPGPEAARLRESIMKTIPTSPPPERGAA